MVTLVDISVEIGRTKPQTKKLLAKTGFLGHSPKGTKPGQQLYEAQAVEAVKALIGVPHRKVSANTKDWLSDYLGGNSGN